MQLTLFTDYALRTLLYVYSHTEKSTNVREISEYHGISRNHLVKVVHQLSQLGYISTSKGKGGGISRVQDAGKLRLGDLITKLEPNMNMVECFDRKNNRCRITESCLLKGYLYEAMQSFINTMNQYTLEDAVKNEKLITVNLK